MRVFCVLVAVIVALGACSDDEPTLDPVDAGDDVGEDAGDEPLEYDRVDLDFEAHFEEPSDGFVRAAQVEDEAELVDGEVAKGLVGDWLLENEHGRYLVGLGDRDIGPCSWDGNVIEAEQVRGGEGQGSTLGEICLLINIAQTMRPQGAEILEDGSDGRAVVAVTGEVAPLDFLNIETMVSDVAPGLLDGVYVDPDRSPPLKVTVYYVLTPESDSLRVLTAFRNDGDDEEFFNATHLVLSGSTGSFFNPLSEQRGWGFSSLGADSLEADPVSFAGYFTREGGYAVVPDPQEHMEEELPVGAGMVGISGVIALIHGTTDLMYLLLANEAQIPITDGYIGLEPGEVDTVGYRLYPSGDGSVSTAADRIYGDLGVETTTVSGRVVDEDGQGVEGVQVTALEDGERAFSTEWTGTDGAFSMDVPRSDAEWEIRARADEVLTRVEGVGGDAADVDLGDVELLTPATVQMRVRTPDGKPVPARVVVECADGCGEQRFDSRERDSSFTPPGGWLRIVEVGIDGDESFDLAPGRYELSVNRGLTYSTWPRDATTGGGEALELEAGDEVVVDAEIAEVVDTTGTLSADFHIHAMASPDSSTSDMHRVRDFLAGGLDVMVSSDHDAVVDFGPAIEALGAGDHITSVVGNEITSSTLGHVNAFPLEVDDEARRGGPLDWSGGGGTHMTLQQVSDAVRDHPGDQVLQVNHPRFPGGFIGLVEADVLTGQSFADPASLRMPSDNVDEETGDTGLWSDDFDALEIYNGFSMTNFWGAFRWWLTMVGRGFAPTATAVSDTHGIYGSLGASPRSFVFVDEGKDTPATMELEHFVDRVLDGALMGTSGPMMRVEIENDGGDTAGIGDVVEVDGEATARVTLEMPEWVDIDTLDVFKNVPADELQGQPGENVDEPVEPTQRIEVEFGDEHRELVAEGDVEHYRLRKTVEIPLEVDSDSYVVFMAYGLNARNMRPVIASFTRPLAYTNPVFMDADGDGWDDPPLRQARIQQMALSQDERPGDRRLDRAIIGPGDELTPEKVGEVFEALQCDHGVNLEEDHGHSHEHGHSHGHSH